MRCRLMSRERSSMNWLVISIGYIFQAQGLRVQGESFAIYDLRFEQIGKGAVKMQASGTVEGRESRVERGHRGGIAPVRARQHCKWLRMREFVFCGGEKRCRNGAVSVPGFEQKATKRGGPPKP